MIGSSGDTALIDHLATKPLFTVEENTLAGGFGSAVLEYLSETQQLDGLRLHRIGIPDLFSEQGTRAQQLQVHGLDAEGLFNTAKSYLNAQVHQAI